MDDEMVDGPSVTFDKSCAHCPAFMPQMVIADPNTGIGQNLFGLCMVRAHGGDLCPASVMHGVHVDIHVARGGNMPTRAIMFHDERDQ